MNKKAISLGRRIAHKMRQVSEFLCNVDPRDRCEEGTVLQAVSSLL